MIKFFQTLWITNLVMISLKLVHLQFLDSHAEVDTCEVHQIITKKPQVGRSTIVNSMLSRSSDHRTVSLIRGDDTRTVHLTFEHFQQAKACLIRCLMMIAHNRVFSLHCMELHRSSTDLFILIRNLSLCPRLHLISTFHLFTHTYPPK